MKSILVVSLLLLASLAHAEDVRINFQTLLATYDNSAKKSFDDLKGVYAGKCTSIFNKDVIGGVLFVAVVDGVKKAFVLVNERDENYFYNGFTAENIARDLDYFGRSARLVSEQPLVGEEGEELNKTQWHIGSYQGAVVLKGVYKGQSGYRDLYGHLYYINTDDTFGACLFTKKLQ